MIVQEILTPRDTLNVISSRMLSDGYDMVLDLEKSKGMTLYDSLADRKFMDFFGFFASNPVGMNHPDLLEPEFLKELQTAALNKVTNSDIYTRQMAQFVKALSDIATPPYMKYFFFIDGGALAVENALKTAFDWKVRKNKEKGVEGEKGGKVIHLKEAFHGRSGYTMSLTNTFDPRKTMYYPKFDWPRITNPKLHFPLTKESVSQTEQLERQSLREMEESFRKYGDDIVAFIVEPIQGEGGDNHFRKEFFAQAYKLVHENDAMFIVDEVQSGLGITGKWWAHQHFDFEPDIMAFGKKTQVCGIMVGNKVDEVKDNVFHTSSRINSTWGGNITDMVRATKYLEIIKEHNLVGNAEKIGGIMVKMLNEISEGFPNLVENPRGRGLFDAIDLKDQKSRDELSKKLFSGGVLALKAAERTIRFRPPLIIDENDVNLLSERLRSALSEMSN